MDGDCTMIDIFKTSGTWQDVKDAAMHTMGKDTGKTPDHRWKRQILLAEHSPIRLLKFFWRWVGILSWVSVHIVRHKIGIEHYVKSQRTDRTGVDRNNLPQGSLVNHSCDATAQALINMSRKRLCTQASKETRDAWLEVKDYVKGVNEELASVMVPECIYRGFCPELKPCGYADTEAYRIALHEYRYEHKPECKMDMAKSNEIHAFWEQLDCGDGPFDYQFRCSNCGGVTPFGAYLIAPDYCPHCPAKMDAIKGK